MYMRALPPREELLGDTSADGGHFCQKTQLVDSSKEVLRGLSE